MVFYEERLVRLQRVSDKNVLEQDVIFICEHSYEIFVQVRLYEFLAQ
jgi:hypothetical protein